MRRSVFVLALGLLAACGGGGGSEVIIVPAPFTSFQAAVIAIGQPDLTSNGVQAAAANTVSEPGAPCPVGARLFVPDPGFHRVLAYNAQPGASGASADFVLGQALLTDSAANRGGAVAANTLQSPWAVCTAGGRLFVSDTANNRVLIFDAVPTTSGAAANRCVGQASLTSNTAGAGATGLGSPRGIHAVGTKLIVCDFFNHRVMIWNTIPAANGAAADLVLGQADATGTLANRGVAQPAADSLASPFGVWSDGTRLAVADGGNNRVLLWNSFPTSNGQAADHVLGQPSFTVNAPATTATGMRIPTDVTSDGTRLIVGDCENNRILIFDAYPVASNTAATTVLGQGVFTLGVANDDNQDGALDGGLFPGTATARTMNTTGGFSFVKFIGGRLYSGDYRNHRALIYQGQ
ncbi:MAG: hypothetical protein O2894_04950 [Planctomycetota bacterium]|nr:hypothetical protein [Planctomycetota bacterium]